MAAGAVGSCWGDSTWEDTAWEADTWADAFAVSGTFGDLTTLFTDYVQDLRDASAAAPPDSTTEVALDEADVISSVGAGKDKNTRYARYLS